MAVNPNFRYVPLPEDISDSPTGPQTPLHHHHSDKTDLHHSHTPQTTDSVKPKNTPIHHQTHHTPTHPKNIIHHHTHHIHKLKSLQPYAYYIMLVCTVTALFLTNFAIDTVLSPSKTLFSFLQQKSILAAHPALTFLTPILLIFTGALGMMVLLEHIKLHEKKRLMAFLGGVAYILNPFTLQLIHMPLFPMLWFFAILPWHIWTTLKLISSNKKNRIQPLLLFTLTSIIAFPAYAEPLNFVVFFVILLVLLFGLIFSPYFFKAVWQSPSLLILFLILQIHWLAPQLLIIADRGFTEILTPSVPFTLNLPPLQSFFSFFLIIALLGILRIHRYYFLFLFLLALVLLPFLPVPPIVLLTLKNYQLYMAIPTGFIFAYFFACGIGNISFIATTINHILHARKNPARHPTVVSHAKSKDKTPFDIYTEFLSKTSQEKAGGFTPIQFTEHFVQHVMHLHEHEHEEHHARRTSMIPRVIGYIAFTLFVIANANVFQGNLFGPQYLLSVSPQMQQVISYIRTLPAETVTYYPSTLPPAAELKTAIEREDRTAYQSVLQKYGISYIVFDTAGFLNTQTQFISSDSTLSAKSSAASVVVFERSNAPFSNNKPVLLKNAPNIGPDVLQTESDVAYKHFSTYISTEQLPYVAFYPFLDLQDKKISLDKKTTRLDTQLSEKLMSMLDQYDLEAGTEAADINLVGDGGQALVIPSTLYTELIANKFIVTMNSEKVRYFEPKKQIQDTVWLETQALEQRYGYLLEILAKENTNKLYELQIFDKTRFYQYHNALIKPAEPYLIEPKYSKGIGYMFSITPELFQTFSIYYFPYDDIANTRFIHRELMQQKTKTEMNEIATSREIAGSLYQVALPDIPKENEQVLGLWKPHSSGWKMYAEPASISGDFFKHIVMQVLPFTYGKEVKTQLAVNNWANGWLLDPALKNSTVYLVFWPLYVSYAGWVVNVFLICLFGISWIVKQRKNDEQS